MKLQISYREHILKAFEDNDVSQETAYEMSTVVVILIAFLSFLISFVIVAVLAYVHVRFNYAFVTFFEFIYLLCRTFDFKLK